MNPKREKKKKLLIRICEWVGGSKTTPQPKECFALQSKRYAQRRELAQRERERADLGERTIREGDEKENKMKRLREGEEDDKRVKEGCQQ